MRSYSSWGTRHRCPMEVGDYVVSYCQELAVLTLVAFVALRVLRTLRALRWMETPLYTEDDTTVLNTQVRHF